MVNQGNSKKEFDFILSSGYQKKFPIKKFCKGYIFL